MTYIERAKEIKEKITKAEHEKSRVEGNLEALKKQKEDIINEIVKAGSTPETIEQDISELSKQIEEKLRYCEEIINRA